jgi:hypothetical protein
MALEPGQFYGLLKPGEILPPNMSVEPGRLFKGDLVIRCTTPPFGSLLTCDQVVAHAVYIGRIQKRNPNYRYGNKLLKEQLHICLTEDFFHPFKTIKQRILRRLR